MDIYEGFCLKKQIPFHTNFNILSPDETTLFCTSGMQRFKKLFTDTSYSNTFSNVQQCLRLNDLDEVGDLTHYLNFNMLGFFSFREWKIESVIDFWLCFMKEIGTYPDYITLHEDRLNWSQYYPKDMEIKIDNNCKWSDGSIGGYCTEFYKNDVEIGNIVNPLETCIDVGFGCERLLSFMYEQKIPTRLEIIKETSLLLIDSGIKQSSSKQGYILRKLLIELILSKVEIDDINYKEVLESQIKSLERYEKLSKSKKVLNKGKEWWKDTHGIDIENIEKYRNLLNNKV